MSVTSEAYDKIYRDTHYREIKEILEKVKNIEQKLIDGAEQNPVDSMVRQGDQPVQNAGRWVIDSVGELKEILKQFDDEVAVLTDQSFVTVIYSINQDGFCSIDIGG